jgi:dCMP deaminase
MSEKRQRPSWDEFFMFKALWAARRSSCHYLQTGAVIVKDKRVIATGYNGAPPGIENCLEKGCRKDEKGVDFDDKGKGICRGVHAEINAMNQIARQDLIGTKIYTLYFPCSACAKAIVGNGLKEVIYSKIYQEPNSLTNELFSEAGVKLRKFDLDIEKYFKMIMKVDKQTSRQKNKKEQDEKI